MNTTKVAPFLVADVGNSRIKWGRCSAGQVVQMASLTPDLPAEWDRQLALWKLEGTFDWTISGVHPTRLDRFVDWLRQQEHRVVVLRNNQLPLQVFVDNPEQVGIDRLLNAVAAAYRIPVSLSGKIIIDAGTAVTVDWVDERNAFRGGAILPGLRLMAQALRNETALLPLVEIASANPSVPGISTTSAIEAGVFWAVAGGINALVRQLKKDNNKTETFLTGGAALVLAPALDQEFIFWPEMTLEGIRLARENMP